MSDALMCIAGAAVLIAFVKKWSDGVDGSLQYTKTVDRLIRANENLARAYLKLQEYVPESGNVVHPDTDIGNAIGWEALRVQEVVSWLRDHGFYKGRRDGFAVYENSQVYLTLSGNPWKCYPSGSTQLANLSILMYDKKRQSSRALGSVNFDGNAIDTAALFNMVKR